MTSPAPARSETEAFNAYSGALQRAVACFVSGVGFRRSPKIDPVTGERSLTHVGAPFRLLDRHGTAVAAMVIRLHYRPIQISTALQQWEIRTVRYICEVHSVAPTQQQVAGYHWHPEVPDMTYAHCHMYVAQAGMDRLHLPTRFIMLGSILRWLMRDFSVYPIATNWLAELERADQLVEASLQWALAQERPGP